MSSSTKRKRAPFIAVEGLDGAGTTTQACLVSDYLQSLGFKTWTTREPSSGPLGRAVRAGIEGDEAMSREALALGFAADRMHHMSRPGGIQHMQANGVWVISDRYVLSSLAYQSAQGLEFSWLLELNKHAPCPDVTVFIDTPVKVCLERIESREQNLEDQFHRRTALINTRREYMHALAQGSHVGKLVTADGSKEPRRVLAQIVRGMTEELHSDFGLFVGLQPTE